MLSKEEIKQFIDEDKASLKKRAAIKGQDYYEGRHDIKDYRLFYFNADGVLVEDKTRSNARIAHCFYQELVDQAVQYILSGGELIKSDDPMLQDKLDEYFNDNEDFIAELSACITGCKAKGFEYMFAYKNMDDKLSFMCADSITTVEVESKYASDGKKHVIYWYLDRIDIEGKKIKRIQDWDEENVYFYTQVDEGDIELDKSITVNPKPHVIYQKNNDERHLYTKSFGYVPFFRLDNNKKQISDLSPVKDLIDDYDLMASGLTNNLQDFDTPLHVVKGFQGDNLDELQQNLKTKKIIGVDEEGGVEVKTIDIPYEARKQKLELDEKNIYRFGMGLNTAGLKDTSATTNIAIKAAYSLLDLKCNKFIIILKQFLRKIIKAVLDEINSADGTDYQMKEIYFDFEPEIMSNAQENAQIDLTKAQEMQARINVLLSLASHLDNETLMINICDVLDIDYEEIKDKLPDPDEADNYIKDAQAVLDAAKVGEGNGTGEQEGEGASAGIPG